MKKLVTPLLIFWVSLSLRLLAITVPLNTDEGVWLPRGVSFWDHLLAGDLAGTFLKMHPGVPNMWTIGAGVGLQCQWQHLTSGQLNLLDLPACFKLDTFPIDLFVGPRILQGIITSACMAILYLLAKQLLGRSIALVGIGLLMFEPFFVAYQRFITTDAFLTDFSAISILLLLLYFRNTQKRLLLLGSGVMMGLATAAKTPALFLIVAVVIWVRVMETGAWAPRFPQRGWPTQRKDLLIWGATAAVTFIVIWPALWGAPLLTTASWLGGAGVESFKDKAFLGQETNYFLGFLFYPLVLVFRLSPLTQLGLIAGGLSLLRPQQRRQLANAPELMALAIVPLTVLFILLFPTHKMDRYIMMAMPQMALLAAAGWLQLVSWGRDRIQSWTKRPDQPPAKIPAGWMATPLALGLMVGQLMLLLPHYPYYIAYYNPVFGGVHVAQRWLMIGQGEGLDQAAQWLRQDPAADDMTIASWYPRIFRSYFRKGETVNTKNNPYNWVGSNRVVTYINQIQRQKPRPEIVDYFEAQSPLYTVRHDGLDYVKVYAGPIVRPRDLEGVQRFSAASSVNQGIRLVGYDLPPSDRLDAPKAAITLYWEFTETPPTDLQVAIGLRDANQTLCTQIERPSLVGYLPTDDTLLNQTVRDVYPLDIPKDCSPSQMQQLTVRWQASGMKEPVELEEALPPSLIGQANGGDRH